MIGYDGKTVSEGKGSKQRKGNKKQYSKNYDLIDWGRKPKPCRACTCKRKK
jgi:hypothetical protein